MLSEPSYGKVTFTRSENAGCRNPWPSQARRILRPLSQRTRICGLLLMFVRQPLINHPHALCYFGLPHRVTLIRHFFFYAVSTNSRLLKLTYKISLSKFTVTLTLAPIFLIPFSTIWVTDVILQRWLFFRADGSVLRFLPIFKT